MSATEMVPNTALSGANKSHMTVGARTTEIAGDQTQKKWSLMFWTIVSMVSFIVGFRFFWLTQEMMISEPLKMWTVTIICTGFGIFIVLVFRDNKIIRRHPLIAGIYGFLGKSIGVGLVITIHTYCCYCCYSENSGPSSPALIVSVCSHTFIISPPPSPALIVSVCTSTFILSLIGLARPSTDFDILNITLLQTVTTAIQLWKPYNPLTWIVILYCSLIIFVRYSIEEEEEEEPILQDITVNVSTVKSSTGSAGSGLISGTLDTETDGVVRELVEGLVQGVVEGLAQGVVEGLGRRRQRKILSRR